MNVLSRTPLSLTEIKQYVQDFEGKKGLEEYLKKFTQLSKEKAMALKEEIIALNNAKIKSADIVKIVDFLPKTGEEANKIFTDVSLTEEESNAIIEIVKKY